MKEFSVCYDRFCLGNYTLVCDVSDTVQATADLGAFEMYVGHVERWAGGDDEGIR